MWFLNQYCAALEKKLKLKLMNIIPLESLDIVLIENLTEKINIRKSTFYK
jgi:hypothetical protein